MIVSGLWQLRFGDLPRRGLLALWRDREEIDAGLVAGVIDQALNHAAQEDFERDLFLEGHAPHTVEHESHGLVDEIVRRLAVALASRRAVPAQQPAGVGQQA